MTEKVTKLGVIGCGNISNAYFNGAKIFENIEIIACSDLKQEAAEAKAEEHGVKALSVDELLADPGIEIVVNLTVPGAHAEVDLQILEAGKHVYSEKPLAVTLESADRVLSEAEERGLRVGCAPDTFLGAGIQTSRKAIDDGWIGRPIAGTAFMMCAGHERWHPNPFFYYQPGGGPMLDMGPYYITALLNLLGPAKSVSGYAVKGFDERTCTCSAHYGTRIPVEVPTTYSGAIEFECGAVISMVMSFDVQAHSHNPIEIYGSEASLQVPDPNGFGGKVNVRRLGQDDWSSLPLPFPYVENSRIIGVADMAEAIEEGREHRASGALARHALEIMRSFEVSCETGRRVDITAPCVQPDALPLGLLRGRVSTDATV